MFRSQEIRDKKIKGLLMFFKEQGKHHEYSMFLYIIVQFVCLNKS